MPRGRSPSQTTGAVSASFGYDPFGRRISKTLGETTTKVLFDGPNAVQETQGSSTANLLTGLLPDSTYARSTGSATESLLSDALGSVIGLGNGEGEVETAYTYDPFGGTSREGATSGNPFQYAGRENDGGGLYFDRARYYNPAGARFIGQDPLGEVDGPNLYRYADNSPLDFSDPYGTTPHEERARRIWQAAEEEANRDTPTKGNFEKMSEREIKRVLREAETDAHTDKEETVGKEAKSYDYYRDKTTGEIYLMPKRGGEPIPTGLGR